MAPIVAAALLVVAGCTYSERSPVCWTATTPADRRATEQ